MEGSSEVPEPVPICDDCLGVMESCPDCPEYHCSFQSCSFGRAYVREAKA